MTKSIILWPLAALVFLIGLFSILHAETAPQATEVSCEHYITGTVNVAHWTTLEVCTTKLVSPSSFR